MSELKFRNLRADEIDCRVAAVKLPTELYENGRVEGNKGGVSLLLYKDARVDQNILDETVGPMNWQRHHSRDNANCTVALWDDDKKQWIEKEDTGTESYTEAEKGLASDSFKRACFNWGIGRELYTAPFIWIAGDKCNIYSRNTQKGPVGACNDKFYVVTIKIVDGRITQLVIANASKGNQIVFTMGVEPKREEPKKEEPKKEEPREIPVSLKLDPITVSEIKTLASRAGVDLTIILQQAQAKEIADLTKNQADGLKKALQRKILQNRSANGNQSTADEPVA